MSTKTFLNEAEMPRQWYNVAADLPFAPDPPIHPGTHQPLGPADLEPIFPMNIIEQEVSTERWIDIPEDVLEKLSLWRPTPLHRARRLEEAIGTKCRIYFKNESVSPAGSHKPNTAVAQAYYNKVAGVKRLTTETGAGQWGSALSMATQMFGIECKVFMVKCSFEQKPYRKLMMNTWGATVVPSPSTETEAGRKILEKDPECTGALGIAISEAVEQAVQDPDTKYSLGSVTNHVCLHQTIIGLEAKKQLAAIDEQADVVVGCVGGGSNFAGIAFPFLPDKWDGRDIRIVGAEPSACPTLTRGQFAYDFGDTAMLTPLFKMFTLGHDFVPESIHAGGLRYHGDSPMLSALVDHKDIEAVALDQVECFEAAVIFARSEGIIPAPETSHAIKGAIDEAKKADAEGKPKTILFNFSGHGLVDMAAYDYYFSGNMKDYPLPPEVLERSLALLPKIGG